MNKPYSTNSLALFFKTERGRGERRSHSVSFLLFPFPSSLFSCSRKYGRRSRRLGDEEERVRKGMEKKKPGLDIIIQPAPAQARSPTTPEETRTAKNTVCQQNDTQSFINRSDFRIGFGSGGILVVGQRDCYFLR